MELNSLWYLPEPRIIFFPLLSLATQLPDQAEGSKVTAQKTKSAYLEGY